MQALLLARQTEAVDGVPQCLQTAREATALLQLLQRGVGLLPYQLGEAFQVVGPEGRRRSAPVRLGVKRPGGSATLKQANDEGGADAKKSGNLTNRAFVMIDGGHDPFSKI